MTIWWTQKLWDMRGYGLREVWVKMCYCIAKNFETPAAQRHLIGGVLWPDTSSISWSASMEALLVASYTGQVLQASSEHPWN